MKTFLSIMAAVFFDQSGTTLALTRHTSNTLITAAAFNANYDALEAVVNGGIDQNNIDDDAVTAAKLNSDVVRSGYGISQHTDGSLQFDPSDTNPCLEITDGGVRVKVDSVTINRASGGLEFGNIANNTYLKSKNAAGTSTVDLIKANASDIPVIPDGAQMATNAAPSDDKGISNKKYVDDQIAAAVLVYDNPVSKSAGTTYQASTDGTVYGYCTGGGGGLDIAGYTDGSNPPTTQVMHCQFGAGTPSNAHSFSFPVKAGNYYKIVNSAGTLNAYYFIGKV